MQYKTKCGSLGRGKSRPPFKWCQFVMSIAVKSLVVKGRQVVQVTQGSWMVKWGTDNLKDVIRDAASRAEAEEQWM